MHYLQGLQTPKGATALSPVDKGPRAQAGTGGHTLDSPSFSASLQLMELSPECEPCPPNIY